MNGDVTCVHNMCPSGMISGTYLIKLSVEVVEEANSSGLCIILILLELNLQEMSITSGSFVDTKMLSTYLHHRSCLSLIEQSPPSIPAKGFVFFFGTRSLPARIGRNTFTVALILKAPCCTQVFSL